MSDYSNHEGSTGSIKDGAFVPFKSQAEADKSLKPAKAEPEADATAAVDPDAKPAKK